MGGNNDNLFGQNLYTFLKLSMQFLHQGIFTNCGIYNLEKIGNYLPTHRVHCIRHKEGIMEKIMLKQCCVLLSLSFV